MKRLICVFLTILMIAAVMTSTAVTTQAVRAPMYIGDLDHDNHMTIYDATRIQRWLVGLGELDSYRESDPSWFSEKLALFLGDVNGDGACDIIDATCIQRFVAGMTDTRIWDFSTWAYYIEDTRLYADYDSGKAAVGKPVTFHADITQKILPKQSNFMNASGQMESRPIEDMTPLLSREELRKWTS